MNLSPSEKAILIALRKGNHLKYNPTDAKDVVDLPQSHAEAAARQLIAIGLVKKSLDSSRPGALVIRLTDQGLLQADAMIEQDRKPTMKERLKALPVGKGSWEVVKLALAAVFGAVVKSYFG